MEYFVKNRLVRYVLSFVGIGCCASGLSQEMSVPTQLRCDLLLQTDYQSAYGLLFRQNGKWHSRASMSV